MHREGVGSIARYDAALTCLPVATRTIFLLHRQEGWPYREIARYLSVAPPVVEAYVAEALFMLVRIIEGKRSERFGSEQIVEAEPALLARHLTTFDTWLCDWHAC